MIMNTNTDIDIITDFLLRPAPFRRRILPEVACLILGVENDGAEYWAEKLDDGRARIETSPYDGDDEWDVCLSVFILGDFIGDILLRGTDLGVA